MLSYNVQIQSTDENNSVSYSTTITSQVDGEWLGNVNANLNWTGPLSDELKTRIKVELSTLLMEIVSNTDYSNKGED